MNAALITGLFSVLAVAVGGLLGYLFSHKGRNDELSISMVKEYEIIAQELYTILNELLTLSMMPKYYTANQCKEIDKELEKFFFKYYIILPQPVEGYDTFPLSGIGKEEFDYYQLKLGSGKSWEYIF